MHKAVEERGNRAESNVGEANVGESGERALTIALVVDTVDTQGNGTSNSALQYAAELERQGHHVRLVGVGAPRYAARVKTIPVVSWVAAQQQMQFAEPDEELFHRAFDGVDVAHVYMPFAFGRHACRTARAMGVPVTAGFHLQPQNIMYSAGPLRFIPGMSSMLYRLFDHWLYRHVRHVHVPSAMIARQLRRHGYRSVLHVISNGYSPRFAPRQGRRARPRAPKPFRIIASGRLTREKNHITLIRAVAMCRHREDIELRVCGTGPLARRLRRRAKSILGDAASIGFMENDRMPATLRSCDLFVHCSTADIESLSVIEAMASGLVPVIASCELSAARQFALVDESLFPARRPEELARRIDWWIDHPDARAYWGGRYARFARERYGIESSVRSFVAMERQAIADFRRAGE